MALWIRDIALGVPGIALLLGAGLILTFRLRGAQFRLLGQAIRSVFGKKQRLSGQGAVSPFQAVCTALAGTMGTGNIAGVAGAIALGGPGAVFWMWLAALLGMATKYTEVVLAVRFRRQNAAGEWVGGPMYYMEAGLGKRFRPMAKVFCLFGLLASFGIGNAAQINTLSESIITAAQALHIKADSGQLRLCVGVIAAATVGLILLGGMRRIAQTAETLIPWVSAVYIVCMLCVVAGHLERIPVAAKQIFQGAFTPKALGGGMAGITLWQAVRVGVGRGVFTNEAGMGSSPIAHAGAQTASPVQQGLLGIFEVFADTMVICTLTAFGILASGCEIPYGTAVGAELTTRALSSTFGEQAAGGLMTLCIACFALSTLVGWSFYGVRCAEYLGGAKSARAYRVIFTGMTLAGALLDMRLVWEAADVFNALMALPNLAAVLLLSGETVRLTKDFLAERKIGEKG